MQPVEPTAVFWVFVVVACIIGGLAVYANWLRPIKNYHKEKYDDKIS